MNTTRPMRSLASGILLLSSLLTTAAHATSIGTTLPLENGWTNAPFSTSIASVSLESGIVTLAGAIGGGTGSFVFKLPSGYRPSTVVHVPVDLCGSTHGELVFDPGGDVAVQAQTSFSDAQCFTSLDGVSFSRVASGFTSLSLQNGWTNAPVGTSNAALKTISGIVHFKGAINTGGTNATPFVLPAAFRPSHDVYVPVGRCSGNMGRLHIQANGTVVVEPEGGTSWAPGCFFSLDGASYALSPSSTTALSLVNGWTHSPFGTAAAKVASVSGIVRFAGAIASGSAPTAFTLPSAFRPLTDTFVHINLCSASGGRLHIAPSGIVSVEAEGNAFSNAQCFTSLDGASFALGAFAPIALSNGWTNTPFNTSAPAVNLLSGVVSFKGAMATTGTNPVAFTLPAALRPATNVYVPVDLCRATKGRLFIQPGGTVTVQAEGSIFANAQCETSLDGVSFLPNAKGATTLATASTGWTGAPFGTSAPAVKLIGGVVHLKGAVSTTSDDMLISVGLPPDAWPDETVGVQVDMCSATNGHIVVDSGDAAIYAQPQDDVLANAECFTSLDGATYLPAALTTSLTLKNGWQGTARAKNFAGMVRFQGIISTAGSNPVPFTLPAALRPSTTAYVNVTTCLSHKARVVIQPDGTVTVQTDGDFAQAQCATELDGAWFAQ